MTTRRGFLSGILAAGIAPAVLSQGSAMRIWVPRNQGEIILRRWVPFGPSGAITAVDEKVSLADMRLREIVDPHGSRQWSTLRVTHRSVNLNENWMRA